MRKNDVSKLCENITLLLSINPFLLTCVKCSNITEKPLVAKYRNYLFKTFNTFPFDYNYLK